MRCWRRAPPSPSGRRPHAYNRGQVLYRIAEVMEGRREQFISEVSDSEGVSSRKAGAHVDAAIDRWVWYAGWADKYAQVIGNTNTRRRTLLQFLRTRAHGSRGSGSTAGRQHPRLGQRHCSDHRHRQRRDRHAEFVTTNPAITLAECLATSDVPAGVVNILTGGGRQKSCHGWPSTRMSTPLDLTGIVDEERGGGRPRAKRCRHGETCARSRSPRQLAGDPEPVSHARPSSR